jgi:2-keto-4-pentenoate hydratase/2-oxohepta-3-ene-1,7-dioic acid hydratase in catechol pathway
VKLLRVGPEGAERPAALAEDGSLLDLSGVTRDIDPGFLATGLEDLRAAYAAGELPRIQNTKRVGAPVARPGKVVCIGLNYRDHAAETKAEIPAEPIIFMKAVNTVVGPTDDVLIPRGSQKTDYEVELAVVLKGRARYLDSPDEARDLIAGYAISNDVSEREYQLERGGTWDKGKSCETFNPLGPYLVTADEIADPQDLGLRLWANGELRQDGNTKDMIFSFDEFLEYGTRDMTFRPGDMISAGTCAGTANDSSAWDEAGKEPLDAKFLKPGDVVEIYSPLIGTLRNRIVAKP